MPQIDQIVEGLQIGPTPDIRIFHEGGGMGADFGAQPAGAQYGHGFRSYQPALGMGGPLDELRMLAFSGVTGFGDMAGQGGGLWIMYSCEGLAPWAGIGAALQYLPSDYYTNPGMPPINIAVDEAQKQIEAWIGDRVDVGQPDGYGCRQFALHGGSAASRDMFKIDRDNQQAQVGTTGFPFRTDLFGSLYLNGIAMIPGGGGGWEPTWPLGFPLDMAGQGIINCAYINPPSPLRIGTGKPVPMMIDTDSGAVAFGDDIQGYSGMFFNPGQGLVGIGRMSAGVPVDMQPQTPSITWNGTNFMLLPAFPSIGGTNYNQNLFGSPGDWIHAGMTQNGPPIPYPVNMGQSIIIRNVGHTEKQLNPPPVPGNYFDVTLDHQNIETFFEVQCAGAPGLLEFITMASYSSAGPGYVQIHFEGVDSVVYIRTTGDGWDPVDNNNRMFNGNMYDLRMTDATQLQTSSITFGHAPHGGDIMTFYGGTDYAFPGNSIQDIQTQIINLVMANMGQGPNVTFHVVPDITQTAPGENAYQIVDANLGLIRFGNGTDHGMQPIQVVVADYSYGDALFDMKADLAMMVLGNFQPDPGAPIMDFCWFVRDVDAQMLIPMLEAQFPSANISVFYSLFQYEPPDISNPEGSYVYHPEILVQPLLELQKLAADSIGARELTQVEQINVMGGVMFKDINSGNADFGMLAHGFDFGMEIGVLMLGLGQTSGRIQLFDQGAINSQSNRFLDAVLYQNGGNYVTQLVLGKQAGSPRMSHTLMRLLDQSGNAKLEVDTSKADNQGDPPMKMLGGALFSELYIGQPGSIPGNMVKIRFNNGRLEFTDADGTHGLDLGGGGGGDNLGNHIATQHLFMQGNYVTGGDTDGSSLTISSSVAAPSAGRSQIDLSSLQIIQSVKNNAGIITGQTYLTAQNFQVSVTGLSNYGIALGIGNSGVLMLRDVDNFRQAEISLSQISNNTAYSYLLPNKAGTFALVGDPLGIQNSNLLFNGQYGVRYNNEGAGDAGFWFDATNYGAPIMRMLSDLLFMPNQGLRFDQGNSSYNAALVHFETPIPDNIHLHFPHQNGTLVAVDGAPAAGNVPVWDAVNSKWIPGSGAADNLGNHTATQALQMAGNTILGDVYAASNTLTLSSSPMTAGNPYGYIALRPNDLTIRSVTGVGGGELWKILMESARFQIDMWSAPDTISKALEILNDGRLLLRHTVDGREGLFTLSGVTSGQSRTYEMPDGSGVVMVNAAPLPNDKQGVIYNATNKNYDATDICRWRGSGGTTPTNPIGGDIWNDTSGTPTVKIYDGSGWVALT